MIQKRKDNSVPYDLFFVVDSNADNKEGQSSDHFLTIPAHKTIMALGSEVFRRQFYGRIKEESSEVRIRDAQPEVFSLFVKCFYEDVDISLLDIKSLAELFYLADKYDIDELKEAIVENLEGQADNDDDPLIAVEAALLGMSYDVFPQLSEALFKKSVKLLINNFGSCNELKVRELFDLSRNGDNDKNLDKVQDAVLQKLKIATLCPNCQMVQAECLDGSFVTGDNFVSGAFVKMSNVKYVLSQGGSSVTLGNPAVHTIGKLNDDMTFSSFSKSGLPLQINNLHSSMYVYNCSLL